MQDQGGRGAGLVSGSILAQQDLVPGTHAPRDSTSLANSSEEGSAFSETGHPMAPASGPVETPRMVSGWDAEVLGDLPQEGWARGASLADICRAAGWATPNTFARFYSLRVEPVSSCVLTSNG